MCDMTSGLAINSPKRAKLNITNIIDKPQSGLIESNRNIFNKLSSTSEMEKQKLFPIFTRRITLTLRMVQNRIKPVTVKKWKHLTGGQMLLDAGQKKFGFTHCLECDIIYHVGDPNEERMPENYHNAKHILSFKGWKNENIVGNLLDARIIKISPEIPSCGGKKLRS
ncbi:n-acetyltransferase eco [Holotrichia oblita]|uniref:N-acetyltransferase eco n=1 Tax=Holotrichia oblita TaxID=644536 RepID=A0ACB9TQG4_HOLOL|nr:n-acetyltransferase eco [Holotrichia oblita]